MTNVTLSCCSIRAAAAAADQVLTSFFRNIPPLKNTSHQCPKNCFVFQKKNVFMIFLKFLGYGSLTFANVTF